MEQRWSESGDDDGDGDDTGLEKPSLLANMNSCLRSIYYAILLLSRPSVCRLLSVTFVHPTPAIEIFGNVGRAKHNAISRKRRKVGAKLVLITNRK